MAPNYFTIAVDFERSKVSDMATFDTMENACKWAVRQANEYANDLTDQTGTSYSVVLGAGQVVVRDPNGHAVALWQIMDDKYVTHFEPKD